MNIEDMKKVNEDRKKRLAAYVNVAAQGKKERNNYVE